MEALAHLARLIAASAAFSVALTTAASAVMPPEAYLDARAGSPNHVQIRITGVSPPVGGMGDCQVHGVVVQVFRGTLLKGEPIVFDVSCYRYGEVPAGGTLWTDYDALQGARYLEAFMSSGPNPAIQRDQVEIILNPREVAYCATDSLSCESSSMAEPISGNCTFWDRAWSLWGLVGRDCGARDDSPLPAFRLN